jgi:predicted MFS family arabinose efflux permease
MISAWIFMIGGIIQAACNTYAPLLVGRFITGCRFIDDEDDGKSV